MPRRPTHLFLSALGWLGFVAVTAWAMAFLAGLALPRTVDSAHRVPTARAVMVDLALLLLFAAQHSVMARPQVKSRLRRRIPAALERTTFVIATDVCLALAFLVWQPFGGQVWHVGGGAALVLWSLCAAGWVLALVSTFAVDHLELMGLRQAGWVAEKEGHGAAGLKVDGLRIQFTRTRELARALLGGGPRLERPDRERIQRVGTPRLGHGRLLHHRRGADRRRRLPRHDHLTAPLHVRHQRLPAAGLA